MREHTPGLAPAPGTDTVPAEPPATLLCVDDEPGILSSLRRLFRPHGYRILTAASGAEGLEVLARENVDVVVSDMRMPEMDGAQFLERVSAGWPDTMRLLLTGYADIGATVEAINRGRIYRYIAKPWDDKDIVLVVRQALQHRALARENVRLLDLTQQQNEALRTLNNSLEERVASRTAELQQLAAMFERANEELKKAFFTSVRVFTGLIELRAGSIGGHSRRVAEHARAVGQRMDLDEAALQDLTLAALMHDIGKIGLADAIIERPFNTLSPEHRAAVTKHPVTGQTALMALEQFRGAALLVRHHHELYDGSGYPDHLAGLAIPLGARVLCAVNEFDALQMGTLTARRLSPQEARRYLNDNRGRRYDPAVIAAFEDVLGGDEAAPADETAIGTGRLLPGMTVARDVLHRDGYLLIARGQLLTEAMIEQLRRVEHSDGHALAVYVRRPTGH